MWLLFFIVIVGPAAAVNVAYSKVRLLGMLKISHYYKDEKLTKYYNILLHKVLWK